MALKFEFNVEEVLSQLKGFKEEAKKDMETAFQRMVFDVHLSIVQEAAKLPAEISQKYTHALSEPENIAAHVWVISLSEDGLWIEEALDPKMDMKPGLLAGRGHRVIPFKYAGAKAQASPLAQGLIMEIKQKLGSDFLNKMEKDSKGRVKTGAGGKPIKVSEHDLGGEGRHMSWKKRKVDETHPLKRLSAYQSRDKQGRARRDVLVFRTVTDGPRSSGKWMHPGLNKKFMDKAMEKGIKDWEEKILPEVFNKWNK